MKYRPHLPDDCPPKDAKSVFSFVYRMISGEVPVPEDFLSFRELKPDKSYPSDCIASGLSVYTEIEGIKRLKRRIPRFRKMKAAKANLNPEHGTMKNTPIPLIIPGGYKQILNHLSFLK